MKRLITVLSTLAVITLGLALPGCNTTKGFGKDVESVGTSMKDSAERNGAD